MVSLDDLQRSFSYDPETGAFFTRAGFRREAGQPTGARNAQGYTVLTLRGAKVLAHRAAWALTHGAWPSSRIDHKNGNRGDNRASNLRLATAAENLWNRGPQRNNTSGYKGICFVARLGKWSARLKANGRQIYLGCFATLEQARASYEAALIAAHGEFARAA